MQLTQKKLFATLLAVAVLGGIAQAHPGYRTRAIKAERLLMEKTAVALATHQTHLQEQTPLQKYQEKMAALSTPSSEEILVALQELTVYNEGLSKKGTVAQMRELAEKLNAPAKVGWNTYRGYPLVEIFDRFVPDNHGNQEIAYLEFNLKRMLVPAEQEEEGYNLLFMPVAQALEETYKELDISLILMEKKNPERIVHLLAQVGKAYHQIYEADKEVALGLSKTLFTFPLRTGWDRATSVVELVKTYGLIERGGGDYYEKRTAQNLQEVYRVSEQEAEELAYFILHFHQ